MNTAAVIGLKGSGKSHLINDLGATCNFKNKYYSADVEITEIREFEDSEGCTAVIACTRPDIGQFKELTSVISKVELTASQRLLIVNGIDCETTETEDFSYHADVINWCITNAFECVVRHHQHNAVTDFDRSAAQKVSLLSEELVGTARVYQALSCTIWPNQKASQNELVVYHAANDVPRDVMRTLEVVESTYKIRGKYYSADINVSKCTPGMRKSSPCHAIIAIFRNAKHLDELMESLPTVKTGDVSILLGIGSDVVENGPLQDKAWEFALEHQYEVVCIQSTDAPSEVEDVKLSERADEQDTFNRVKEALEATEWPIRTDPVKKRCEAPATVSETTAESEEEAHSTFADRWCSGVKKASGCELPPRWVLETLSKKSKPLPEIINNKKGDDDDDEDAGDDFQGMGYDKLVTEAMFLRNHGSTLNRDERQSRAADIAMRMLSAFEQPDSKEPVQEQNK
eukprot:TRINITY_DN10280_c0_g2_i1.p1 TRINITY_DN10280_c0_g2~~TRINITY_DN10280_c0_g2_i1.p1  ORF type:complete len:458 (+),score=97.02 TRINITY_DN10280_c0_g2_i1:58-1431(+)